MIFQRSIMFALCTLLLVGCGGVPFVGALTPEQAAAQMRVGANGQQQPINVVGQRPLPNGKHLVIYRSKEPAPDGQVMDWFGYAEVERWGLGWQPRAAGAQTVDAAPAGTFVQYGTGGNGGGEPNAPVFIYGERLVPEVLAVEGVFDNGQTVRDDTGDGVFVLATTNANTLCELRVLGENDAVLRTFADEQPVAFGMNGPLPSRCQ